jgi:poly-gamma-glutamate capsule biosynthesis protein CapA/YwtB (metallophosphatase superfamily)
MLTLSAIGDIMFTDRVTGACSVNGADALFQDTRAILLNADLTIGNLETPLSNRSALTPYPGKAFVFCAPQEFARSLRFGGVNIVSLANNHIMDYGLPALSDTMRSLQSQGVLYTGAGRNLAEACRPLVCEANGLTIAFLAFTYAFPARRNAPGCCPCDLKFMQKQIKAVKEAGHIIVVSIHHGIEYVDYPDRHILSLFRGAADAGASVVLGHHPHVVQGLEVYKNTLIAYSLGNFISDYCDEEVRRESYRRTALAYFTARPPDVNDMRTIETFILTCRLNRNGLSDYTLTPVKSGQDYRVLLMEKHAAEIFLRRVKTLSDKFSNPYDPVWNEIDTLREKCEGAGLRSLGLGEVLAKVWRLRPRHYKLVIPYLKAKLSKP